MGGLYRGSTPSSAVNYATDVKRATPQPEIRTVHACNGRLHYLSRGLLNFCVALSITGVHASPGPGILPSDEQMAKANMPTNNHAIPLIWAIVLPATETFPKNSSPGTSPNQHESQNADAFVIS